MTVDASTPPVELHRVDLRYGRWWRRAPSADVLHDLSMRLVPGRITGVAGPPGAGKTTLLALCAGELRPSTGNMAWFGAPRCSSVHRRRIGFMAGPAALPTGVTARDALVSLVQMDGLTRDDAGEQVATLGVRLGVSGELLDQRVERVSADGLLRLGMLLALVPRRDLLLCDESLSAFTDGTEREVRAIIHEHADGGGTVLLSAVHPAELAGTADEIHVVSHGRLVRRFGASALVANLVLRLDLRSLDAAATPALRARFPDAWIEGHTAHVPWIADDFDAITFRRTLPAALARVSIAGVDPFSLADSYEALVSVAER